MFRHVARWMLWLTVLACSTKQDLGDGIPSAGDGGTPADGRPDARPAVSPENPEVYEAATAPLHDIWGSAADDIYAVGDYGTVVHFDGNAWSVVQLDIIENLSRVSGCGRNDVWILGDQTVAHFDGSGWYREEPTREYESDDFSAVVCVPDDGAWVVSFDDVFHFSNGQWSEGHELARVPEFAWAGSASNVWFVGTFETSQDRWNGGGFEEFEIGQRLFWEAVDGSGDDDVWLVSDEGGEMVSVRFDGVRFSVHPTTEMPGARDILALGANEAVVVGLFGTVAEWNGSEWQATAAMDYAAPTYNAVWGRSGGPVWVATDSGRVARLR